MQQEDNQYFDEQIRKSLEDASFAPPEGLWDKIEEKLPPRYPFLVRFRYPAAAAILAFTLISSYFIYHKYDYAYRINKFMTESLKESDNMGKGGSATIISGLNLTEIAALIKENNRREKERRLYAAQNSTPLQSIPSEITEFTNGNATVPGTAGTSTVSALTNEGIQGRNNPNTSTGNYLASGVTNSRENVSETRKDRKQRQKSSAATLKISEKSTDNSKNHSVAPGIPLDNGNTLTQETSSEESGNHLTDEMIEMETATVCSISDDESSPYKYDAKKIALKKKKNGHQLRGLYIGPTVGGHYTAMTKSSREGVNTSRMNQKASYGSFYGISAGFIINSRWSVGIEWMYNSGEGQKFEEKIDDIVLNKYIDLDYMKIPVYFKYRTKFLHSGNGLPASLSLLGGAHYSKLKTTNTYVNGEVEPFEVNYNKNQWGFLAGVEFDLYPTNRIFFTVGARATFNADATTFPSLRGADGTAPFSVQTGVYAKLNYLFTK